MRLGMPLPRGGPYGKARHRLLVRVSLRVSELLGNRFAEVFSELCKEANLRSRGAQACRKKQRGDGTPRATNAHQLPVGDVLHPLAEFGHDAVAVPVQSRRAVACRAGVLQPRESSC